MKCWSPFYWNVFHSFLRLNNGTCWLENLLTLPPLHFARLCPNLPALTNIPQRQTRPASHGTHFHQTGSPPTSYWSGSQAVKSDTVCRVPDKQAEPPDTTIIAAPPDIKARPPDKPCNPADTITAENKEPSGTQRTKKREKSLRSWLLAAQKRDVLKESKYLSGCYPLKHTGHKSEILPTCIVHPSNYVTKIYM